MIDDDQDKDKDKDKITNATNQTDTRSSDYSRT
jgi:hypothetical protein